MKLFETFKSALLIALIISAGILTWRTWIYSEQADPTLGWLSAGTVYAQNDGDIPREANRPIKIAVTGDSGRYGAQYSADVRPAYDKLKDLLSEALASSSAPAKSDETRWREALGRESVYLEFDCTVPFSALTLWLDAEPPDTLQPISAARIIIAASRDKSGAELYYKGGSGVFVCRTEVAYSTLANAVDGFNTTNCSFAFEDPGCAADPDAMTAPPPEAPSLIQPYMSSGSVESFSALLASMNMSSLTSYSYSEPDGTNTGTRVIVDNARTFRLTGQGRGVYLDKSSERGGRQLLVSGYGGSRNRDYALETARRITRDAIAAFSGDAEVWMSGLSYDAPSDTYRITFDFRVLGVPVILEEHAAYFIIRSGVVTEIRFSFRGYTLQNERPALMPLSQALAASPKGTMPMPAYIDDGGSSVRAVWIYENTAEGQGVAD